MEKQSWTPKSLIRQSLGHVRSSKKNNDEVPEWSVYKEMVKNHLNDAFNVPFKMPKEYHYAYLRAKGLSQADALEKMGLSTGHEAPVAQPKKSFWKFWE